MVLPDIDDRQVPRYGVAVAAEDFNCFGGLDRGDHAHDWPQDAGRVAGGRAAGLRAGFHETAQTGGFSRQNGYRHAGGADGAAVHPRYAEFDTGIVQ